MIKNIIRNVLPIRLYRLARVLFKRLDFVAGPFSYNEDGFATWDQSADFMQDKKFIEAYRLGKATGSWIRYSEIHWRAYICCWAAKHAMHLDGDFVECGVNRGGYARAILHYADFEQSGKIFYLLDTFKGIPESQITEAERKLGRSHNSYQDCYEDVKGTFELFKSVQIVRGMIPDTLSQVDVRKIAYLSIDMNIVEPEIAAAEYFWDKMVPGAIMLLDDYNFTFHPDQRKAFDAFALRKGVQVLPLPTGQGIVIKP